MSILKFLGLAIAGLVLSSCNMNKLEAKQAKKLDELIQKFKLTDQEADIANLTIVGYKNGLGTPVLASSDLHQAICYATSVEMPEKLTKAHHLYLEHYAEADEDYYVWFLDKNISERDAKEMGDIYIKFHNACKTPQGRLKNLKRLKERL